MSSEDKDSNAPNKQSLEHLIKKNPPSPLKPDPDLSDTSNFAREQRKVTTYEKEDTAPKDKQSKK